MLTKIEDTFGITLPVFMECAKTKNINALDYLESEINNFNSQDFADDDDRISEAWREELRFEINEYLKANSN